MLQRRLFPGFPSGKSTLLVSFLSLYLSASAIWAAAEPVQEERALQRQLALCKQNQEMLAETEHYALIEGEKSLTPAGGSRFIQRSEAAYRIVSGFLYDAVMVEAFPGILGGDSEIQPDCTVRKPGIPIVLMTLIAAAIAAGVWFGPRGWSELHRRLATAVSIMRCYEIANKAVAVIIAACAQGKQKIRVLLRRFL